MAFVKKNPSPDDNQSYPAVDEWADTLTEEEREALGAALTNYLGSDSQDVIKMLVDKLAASDQSKVEGVSNEQLGTLPYFQILLNREVSLISFLNFL